MNFSRTLNWLFGFGLLGGALCTLIAPYVIGVLFTPPVDLGINCVPAVDWSLKKLIATQMVGIGIFMILGLIFQRMVGNRSRRRQMASAKPNT